MHAGSVFSPHLQAGFLKKYRMKPTSPSKGVREGGKLLELEKGDLNILSYLGKFPKHVNLSVKEK